MAIILGAIILEVIVLGTIVQGVIVRVQFSGGQLSWEAIVRRGNGPGGNCPRTIENGVK